MLKIANNKIETLAEVKTLQGLEQLKIIDLQDNTVASVDNYRDTIFEAFPDLDVLDGKYKNGEVYESESDDDFYGEEGEFDQEEQEKILEQLDEETRKRLDEGKLSAEEMEALGLIPEMFMNEEYGEEEVEEGDDGEEKKDDEKKDAWTERCAPQKT